jgi:hypothetical protein
VGLDSVAADGLGDEIFAKAEGVDTRAGGFEGVDEFDDEVAGVADVDKRRQAVEEERTVAEFTEAHAHAAEQRDLFAEELGVARGEFDGLGKQQTLARSVAPFEPIEDLFEEDAFVGGVLVEQDEAAVRFEEGVETTEDADVAERHGEERD